MSETGNPNPHGISDAEKDFKIGSETLNDKKSSKARIRARQIGAVAGLVVASGAAAFGMNKLKDSGDSYNPRKPQATEVIGERPDKAATGTRTEVGEAAAVIKGKDGQEISVKPGTNAPESTTTVPVAINEAIAVVPDGAGGEIEVQPGAETLTGLDMFNKILNIADELESGSAGRSMDMQFDTYGDGSGTIYYFSKDDGEDLQVAITGSLSSDGYIIGDPDIMQFSLGDSVGEEGSEVLTMSKSGDSFELAVGDQFGEDYASIGEADATLLERAERVLAYTGLDTEQ